MPLRFIPNIDVKTSLNCSTTGPEKVRDVTKLCRLCFRYNLCIASHVAMCRSYSNNRPQTASLHASPACLRAYVIERGRDKWDLDSRSGRAKN
jgi:hypothetical protein